MTWIWIGALIVFMGGLITLWPAPASIRRRVASTYAARWRASSAAPEPLRAGREPSQSMEVVLVLAVVVAAVILIAAPLRLGRGPAEEVSVSDQRAELEAAKEAKYREIRDAELDYRTGKLSREDWQQLDGALRADALQLLEKLDELEGAGRTP